jgi:PEP-CTERM motif
MKHLITLVTLFSSIQAGAFTLDFVGVNGATLPPSPLIINVFGYGNVSFTPGFGSALEVTNQYQNPGGPTRVSLDLDSDESVTVTFLGASPSNVDFDIVGLGAGESVGLSQLSPSSFLVSAQGSNGIGIQYVNFGVVPEPSAAILASLGAFGFVLRRRR